MFSTESLIELDIYSIALYDTFGFFQELSINFQTNLKKIKFCFEAHHHIKKQRDDFSVRSHNENLGDLRIAS